MHERRVLFAISTFIILALLSLGCAAPGAPVTVTEKEVVVTATPAPIPEGGIKTIPFLTNESDPASIEVYQAIFSEFSEAHPDVAVDLVIGGHGDIGQRVVSAASVGADLGVILVPPRDMQDFVQAGYLLPLDDIVDELGADQFKRGAVLRARDGHVYALGYAGGVQGTLWVRTDQLADVGMEIPTTYDEMLAAAEAMTRDLDGDGSVDIYGIGLPAGPDGATDARFMNFVLQNCGDFFDKQGNLVFDQPQVLEAVERYIALLDYAPPGITGWSWFDGIDAFISGRVAMHPYGGRLGVNLDRAAPDIRANTRVTYLPAGEKTKVAYGGYDYLAVFSGTRNPDDAKEFLKFFFTGDRLARFELTVPGHLIPPTEDMVQTILDSDNEYVQKYHDDVATLFSVGGMAVDPTVSMGAVDTETCEVNAVYNPMPWASAIFGRQPPVLAEMIQRIVVSGEAPEAAWEWAYTEMQQAADEWKAENPDWEPVAQ